MRVTRTRRLIAVSSGCAAGVVLLLAGEVTWVLRQDFLGAGETRQVSGSVGDGRPLRMVVLGDSTAAGVGASDPQHSVAGLVASALSASTARRLDLTSVAASGARVEDLDAQVDAALAASPALALVLVGANDVTHLTGLGGVRAGLGGAVRRLTAAGVSVVVGTCPDMGAIPSFPQPLRAIAGARGRRVAAAEAQATEQAGGVAVPLGALTGPAFRANPARTFASDGFHPSDAGYQLWADALLPAVRMAVR